MKPTAGVSQKCASCGHPVAQNSIFVEKFDFKVLNTVVVQAEEEKAYWNGLENKPQRMSGLPCNARIQACAKAKISYHVLAACLVVMHFKILQL